MANLFDEFDDFRLIKQHVFVVVIHLLKKVYATHVFNNMMTELIYIGNEIWLNLLIVPD
jgi:hypothetical protein